MTFFLLSRVEVEKSFKGAQHKASLCVCAQNPPRRPSSQSSLQWSWWPAAWRLCWWSCSVIEGKTLKVQIDVTGPGIFSCYFTRKKWHVNIRGGPKPYYSKVDPRLEKGLILYQKNMCNFVKIVLFTKEIPMVDRKGAGLCLNSHFLATHQLTRLQNKAYFIHRREE